VPPLATDITNGDQLIALGGLTLSFTVMAWNTNLLALLGRAPSRIPGDIGHP
jgi:hypothetical protein